MARAVLYQPEHNCAVKGTKAPYFLDCTLFGEQTSALPHFDKHTHFKYCHRVLMGAEHRRGVALRKIYAKEQKQLRLYIYN